MKLTDSRIKRCPPYEDLSNISVDMSFSLQDSNGWQASASRLADDLLKRKSKEGVEQGKSEQLKEASYSM